MISKSSKTLIDELYKIDGKAEIVGGEIVQMSPTGDLPGSAASEIFFSLRLFLRDSDLGGRAYTDNVGFLVDLANRRSFSPDVAYFVGERSGMKFLTGAPQFAVEVRSENDYGPTAEKRMQAKREDYFAAGTKILWDVDLLGDDTIRSHSHETPKSPVIFQRGEIADAGPLIPGWQFNVNDLFEN